MFKWFVAGIIAKLLDIGTTLYMVLRHDITIESNPFVRDMILTYGHGLGWTINGCMAVASLYILYYYRCDLALKVMTILISIVSLTSLGCIFFT